MSILIIEDEANAYDILRKRLLKIAPAIKILAHLKTIVESINWFKNHEEPDLVFLDVELADGQSFEIFNHISITCPVIFTTAYNQYAIKAFSLNSIDYLLKPISEEDLKKALEKFQQMKVNFVKLEFGALNRLLQKKNRKSRQRFLVNSGEKYFFIKTAEVAFLYSEEGLTFLKTVENKRHVLNETLDSIIEELDKEQFFRINRHQIINIESIQTIHEYFNRRFKVELAPPFKKEEFIVSRLRRAAFKNWLNGC